MVERGEVDAAPTAGSLMRVAEAASRVHPDVDHL